MPAVQASSAWRRSCKVWQESGWTVGRNVRIDYRWGAAECRRLRRYAAELVALAPDVILASGASSVGPLLQVTRTVPIVFAAVVDPVGAGFVDSLARPGGNVTGFTQFEYSLSGKWLELLKQIAPGVTRRWRSAGMPPMAPEAASWPSSRPWRRPLSVELTPIDLRDANEIERALDGFHGVSEWRSDRGGELGAHPSRRDRRAGGAAPSCPPSIPIASSSPPAA